MTVNQTSKTAIINWSNFSIGHGSSVIFNNGSGSTLNRVNGAAMSELNGLLSSTGSVYIINPNGLIIGKSGVVQTGGSFIASTLELSDRNFLSGRALSFDGDSKASVINLGQVGALGGHVVLVANTVRNEGTITAPVGDVGLLAGSSVLLQDEKQDGGLFQVRIGSADSSVTNTGVIRSAVAELRAQRGNVYALAGNSGGVVNASHIDGSGGEIWLTSSGGTVTVAGGAVLDASAGQRGDGGSIVAFGASTDFAGTALARGGVIFGDGGRVETSGANVTFDGARVDTSAPHGRTGVWLTDPFDLTITPAAAATISNNLLTTNVVLQTTATGVSGPGVSNATGYGDINIAAPINWSSGNRLTLDAYRNINITAAMSVSGPGRVSLIYGDQSGNGQGNTNLGMLSFGLSGGGYAGSLSYSGAPGAGQSLTINGQAYSLIYSMADLQNINSGLSGRYALAGSLDGYATASWSPVGSSSSNPFTGTFEGLGHVITRLTINSPAAYYVGLFGYQGEGSTIENLGLSGGGVTGYQYVGGIAGVAAGVIDQSYSSNTVSGTYYVGGLAGIVGGLYGSIPLNSSDIWGSYSAASVSGTNIVGGVAGYVNTNARFDSVYSTGNVSASGYFIGGLVGWSNSGDFIRTYASGNVSGASQVGGLIGYFANYQGNVSLSYATGAVTGTGYDVGGLVGQSDYGNIQTSYAVGNASGLGQVGGLVGYFGRSCCQSTISQSYATGQVTGTTTGLSETGGLVGRAKWASITSSYATGNVIGMGQDLGGLVGHLSPNDGQGDPTPSVSLSYASGSVTGSTTTATSVGGLIGLSEGAVSRSYATGAVSGYSAVGGLVGYLNGTAAYAATINQSFAAGATSGPTYVGGLVGRNMDYGAITQSYSTGSASGTSYIGGLVGSNVSATNITETFATGLVTGGSKVGGLFGTTNASVASSYWDIGASGAAASSGAGSQVGAGKTTAALQASLPSGFSNAVWATTPGQTYPYLQWQVPSGTPQVLAGFAYASNGTTGLSGARVTIDAAGGPLPSLLSNGSVTSGANGYFYFLLAPNALSQSAANRIGATVAPSGSSAVAAMTYSDSVQSSVSTFNLTQGKVSLSTSAASYSALTTDLNATFGVAGNAALNASLTGARWTFGATGAFDIDRPLSLTGALALTAQSGVTVDVPVTSNGAVTLLSTTGAFTLNTGASISAGGDISIGSGGAFINNASPSILTTPGRWIVYAASPNGDNFGGLNSNNTAIWNTALGASLSASGNRFAFAYQPTLTVTTTSLSKVYGQDANGSLSSRFSISGIQSGAAGSFLGDTLSAAYSGAPTMTSTGTAASVSVGAYQVNASVGSMIPALGYALAFANSGILTVTPAPITITASANSKVYDGTTSAAAAPTVTWGALYDAAVLSEAYASKHAGTGLTLVPTASITNAGNYAVTLVNSDAGVITPAPVTITASANAKTYDGTTSASATPTVTSGTLYDAAVLSETYASKHAGTGLTLTPTVSLANPGDYQLTLVDRSDGVIHPEILLVQSDVLSKSAGSPDPTLTYALKGGKLYEGDSLTGSISRILGEDPGAYPTLPGTLSASGDYQLNFVSGQLLINPAPVRDLPEYNPFVAQGASTVALSPNANSRPVRRSMCGFIYPTNQTLGRNIAVLNYQLCAVASETRRIYQREK
jgi:filamentous hemagglutinin family protein